MRTIASAAAAFLEFLCRRSGGGGGRSSSGSRRAMGRGARGRERAQQAPAVANVAKKKARLRRAASSSVRAGPRGGAHNGYGWQWRPAPAPAAAPHQLLTPACCYAAAGGRRPACPARPRSMRPSYSIRTSHAHAHAHAHSHSHSRSNRSFGFLSLLAQCDAWNAVEDFNLRMRREKETET